MVVASMISAEEEEEGEGGSSMAVEVEVEVDSDMARLVDRCLKLKLK